MSIHPIRVLSIELQNQIAAGEVVERPASIVKELIENSLDAGATQIAINARHGGIEFLEVSDNGWGIEADEIALALTPHATSKLSSHEDLFAIDSYGFRGEALASIAAVSRLMLTTRTARHHHGWRMKDGELTPHTHPVGTTIRVEDLFFALPARRRFLKQPATEWGHVFTWICRLAIANPSVGFHVTHNDKVVMNVSPTEQLSERLHAMGWGDGGALYEFSYPHEKLCVRGCLQSPIRSSKDHGDLLLYVNNRFVQDKVLRSAILGALRGSLEIGHIPVGAIFLRVPEHEVDVNVHPSKVEVRFLHASQVFHWVQQALSTWASERPWLEREGHVQFSYSENASIPARSDPPRADFKGVTADSVGGSQVATYAIPHREDLTSQTSQRSQEQSFDQHRMFSTHVIPTRSLGHDPVRRNRPSVWAEEFRVLGQWEAKYIVLESQGDLWLCDQHAVHERIRYERFQDQARLGGSSESQMMLMGLNVSMDESRWMRLEPWSDVFQSWGWQWKRSEKGIELTGHPSDLPESRVQETWNDLMATLATAPLGTDLHSEVRHLLYATQACKGAIKAGDHLEYDEMRALCLQARSVSASAHCPHGRPSWISLGLSDVDLLFHRP